MENPPELPKLVKMSDAAVQLGMNPSRLWNLAIARKLGLSKSEGRWMIPVTAVEGLQREFANDGNAQVE